jgi:hypothetical protein
MRTRAIIQRLGAMAPLSKAKAKGGGGRRRGGKSARRQEQFRGRIFAMVESSGVWLLWCRGTRHYCTQGVGVYGTELVAARGRKGDDALILVYAKDSDKAYVNERVDVTDLFEAGERTWTGTRSALKARTGKDLVAFADGDSDSDGSDSESDNGSDSESDDRSDSEGATDGDGSSGSESVDNDGGEKFDRRRNPEKKMTMNEIIEREVREGRMYGPAVVLDGSTHLTTDALRKTRLPMGNLHIPNHNASTYARLRAALPAAVNITHQTLRAFLESTGEKFSIAYLDYCCTIGGNLKDGPPIEDIELLFRSRLADRAVFAYTFCRKRNERTHPTMHDSSAAMMWVQDIVRRNGYEFRIVGGAQYKNIYSMCMRVDRVKSTWLLA